MAIPNDPNERVPSANPTRWLPWVFLAVGIMLIIFLIRGCNHIGGPGTSGGTNDSLKSGSEVNTTTSDVPREATDDTLATDTSGRR